jgi:glucose/arabinose dehydrogenase
MGLLGLAFHPDYKNNGRFFVYDSTPSNQKGSDHQSVLAEYKVSAGSPDKAELTEKRLMAIEQPEPNHNGGCLAFGPDGMLYLGLGDGGGGGDQHGTIGNGQDPETLLGSILRLNVNNAPGHAPFAIPADNPFVNKPGRDEIYAYGLRNPWRFSFDRKTGQLFCADVGQDTYEEVNIIQKGGNYGWRATEGFHVYDEKLKNPLKTDFVPPITEYEHAVGNSVTGGYVYRGKQFPAMEEKYFFGDWSGRLFYLEQMGAEWVRRGLPLEDNEDGQVDFKVNSFGEGENGEIYVLGQKKVGGNSSTGVVYQLTLARQSDKQVGMK